MRTTKIDLIIFQDESFVIRRLFECFNNASTWGHSEKYHTYQINWINFGNFFQIYSYQSYSGSYPSSRPSYPSYPSHNPSAYPGHHPSAYPSPHQGSYPSQHPSAYPGSFPSANPSSFPGSFPSSNPSSFQGSFPSSNPSSFPGSFPNSNPSQQSIGQTLDSQISSFSEAEMNRFQVCFNGTYGISTQARDDLNSLTGQHFAYLYPIATFVSVAFRVLLSFLFA